MTSFAKKWNWIQKCNPRKISAKRKKIEEYLDKTSIKVGLELVWSWIAIYWTRKRSNSCTLFANLVKEREKPVIC